MSIHEGRGQLGASVKDLITLWRAIRPQWTDKAAEDFEERVLRPLEQDARAMANAMDVMAAMIAQAKRDCE